MSFTRPGETDELPLQVNNPREQVICECSSVIASQSHQASLAANQSSQKLEGKQARVRPEIFGGYMPPEAGEDSKLDKKFEMFLKALFLEYVQHSVLSAAWDAWLMPS